ncbi:MAG: ABC transporter ATP-binding protein [Hyphomicrobiales bacterium]
MIEKQAGEIAASIQNVVKVFGDGPAAVTALHDVSLDIGDNEFFTLLGPSGCGKTTLLRIIAGFEDVSVGAVFLYGEEIEQLPPNKRPVNTVFQHYALFPHMSVAENVAFGLRRLKWQDSTIRERVAEVLGLVQLDQLAERMPTQLSGGQQQRVALARALAPNPKVLLLDEPLSALDLKLRQAMRVELKQLQEDTGITFIFVTHDQEEALTMSDRIAVMSEGRIQQIGTPGDIYERPINRFVADFIGDTNLLDVTVKEVRPDGEVVCETGQGFELICDAATSPVQGSAAHVSVRPEKITLEARGPAKDLMPCTVERLIYLGTDTQCLVRLDDGTEIMARNQNAHGSTVAFQPGDEAALKLDAGAARLLVD